MLARFYVILPFTLVVPKGETFSVYEYEEKGYMVRIYPPQISDTPVQSHGGDTLEINRKQAIEANALRVDFIKDDFDRTADTECDPPYEFLEKTINRFLAKLRFVTRGATIHPVAFPNVSWDIHYLNDDESELKQQKDKLRRRGARLWEFSWIAVNNDVWKNLHSLPLEYTPPEWDILLLDATERLPEIGASVVLATTALEVFISDLLEKLAERSTIPSELWKWINNREWLREPTVEERFDDLLKLLLGTSLNENQDLWESFKKLKNARNSFVHEGVAKIGKKPIDEKEARRLVSKAFEIVRFIKKHLPEELSWPEFKHNINVTIKKQIVQARKKDESD